MAPAVSVVMRSMVRAVALPEKTYFVCSFRITDPSGITQSASTSSTPSLAPLLATAIVLCTTVPIFGRCSAGMASELFQKSMPLTSP